MVEKKQDLVSPTQPKRAELAVTGQQIMAGNQMPREEVGKLKIKL